MTIAITLFVYAITTLIAAFTLWAGMKLTKLDGKFIGMLVIAAITGLLAMIPSYGWIIATIVMLVLICKLTTANFWPDAVLMVAVARLIEAFLAIGLLGLLLKLNW